MLRSVMVDSLIDRHSEDSRFDPWFATFAHPTNTYGKGALPERIDYLMYRCGPNIKMRTYDFKLPLIMGIDASGKPMSVSDHEALHAEFIVEMKGAKGTAGHTNHNYISQHKEKTTYYPTDRLGLSYDDLLDLKEEVFYMQDPYSEIDPHTSKMTEATAKNDTSGHITKVPNNGSVESRHEVDSNRVSINQNTVTTVKKEPNRVLQYDKYHRVLYMLNLTSGSEIAHIENNRLNSAAYHNSDSNF